MYPSIIQTFNIVSPTDRLNSPSHSALHNSVSSVLTQVQTIIGTDASTLGTIIGDLRNSDSGGGGHVQTAVLGGTGQTTFAKGNLLVATSPSVLSKVTVGSDGTVLQADSTTASGVKWGTAGGMIAVSTIALSSVWTKPAAAGANSKVLVELWGGGGSGAHDNGTHELGGGGGGGYSYAFFPASILTSVLINVGAGGNAVSTGDVGVQGGTTIFGPSASLLSAFGGGGGGNGTSGGGGGGGGGWYAAGSNGATNSPGGGGSIFGTTGSTGNTTVITAFLYGGAGGGGAADPTTAMGGGSAVFGGAGGGGCGSSIMTTGGVSQFGGNGGASSIMLLGAGSAIGGSTPGGGGGACFGNNGSNSSGPGGMGMAKITTFL